LQHGLKSRRRMAAPPSAGCIYTDGFNVCYQRVCVTVVHDLAFTFFPQDGLAGAPLFFLCLALCGISAGGGSIEATKI